MPRLGRRRLDLPLARARRARLPGLRLACEPRAARRGVRGRRALLRRAARRRGRRGAAGGPATEAELRELRYAVAAGRLRATGHTASDQVETILYRLASSGTTSGIRVRRDDGVVRPLLTVWREETEAYCRAEGLPFRLDSSNADDGARADQRRDRAGAQRASTRRPSGTSSPRSRRASGCRDRSRERC